MLRSGARSPLARVLGHAFAVLCSVLFGWAFVTAIRIAISVDPIGVTTWVFGAALLCLAFVVVATRYVMRRPFTGGYFLVALACLAATFACVLSWFTLLAL